MADLTQPAQKIVPWSTIAADPELQKLPAADYDAVRRDYFDRVIAPNLATDEIGDVWSDFNSRTKRNFVGDAKALIKRGFAGGPALDEAPPGQFDAAAQPPAAQPASNWVDQQNARERTDMQAAPDLPFNMPGQANAPAPFDQDFNTVLSPQEEAQFQQWKAQNAPNDSGADYDLRGAFKSGLKPAENGHWADTFKKPNHPTFSDQSQYANYGKPGSWQGDTFIPHDPERVAIESLIGQAEKDASRIAPDLVPSSTPSPKAIVVPRDIVSASAAIDASRRPLEPVAFDENDMLRQAARDAQPKPPGAMENFPGARQPIDLAMITGGQGTVNIDPTDIPAWEKAHGPLGPLGQSWAPFVADQQKKRAAETQSIQPEDVAIAAASGAANVTTTLGQGVKYAGDVTGSKKLSEVGKAIRTTGEDAETYWQQSLGGMSPAGKAALSGDLGNHPVGTIIMNAMQSAPGMVAMGGTTLAANVVSKGVGLTAKLASTMERFGVPAKEAAEKAANWMATGTASAVEGVFSALQNAAQSSQEVRALSDQDLAKAPGYAKALAATDPTLPIKERQDQVRNAIANAVESMVIKYTTPSTAFWGLVNQGGVLGMLGREAKGGAWHRIWEGANSEGRQELTQSFWEQVIQNVAAKNYYDTNRDPFAGAVQQAVVGGAVGAALGGLGGAAHGVAVKAQPQTEAPKVEPSLQTEPVVAQTKEPALGKAEVAQTTEPKLGAVDEAAVAANNPAGNEPILAQNKAATQNQTADVVSANAQPGNDNRGVSTAGASGDRGGSSVESRSAEPAPAPVRGKPQPAAEVTKALPSAEDLLAVDNAAPAVDKPTVDQAAHEAALSPKNNLPEPTQAQKEAGNYPKGHVSVNGLDISVENPAGSERSGVDASGKPWSVRMASHYGYLKGTVGKDKDHVDIFVKQGTPTDYNGPVFVIDQKNAKGGFDEHKNMIGWPDEASAKAGYLENYSKGWDGIRAITPMSMDGFKAWLAEHDTTKPAHMLSQSVKDALAPTTAITATPTAIDTAIAPAGAKPAAEVVAPATAIDMATPAIPEAKLAGAPISAVPDRMLADAAKKQGAVGESARLEQATRTRATPLADERLKQPEIVSQLQQMPSEAGWAEVGGRLIREQGGQVTGRTSWIPKADWFKGGLGTKATIDEAVRKAVSGDPMRAAEKRVVIHMLDYLQKSERTQLSNVDTNVLNEAGVLDNQPAESQALEDYLTDARKELGADEVADVLDRIGIQYEGAPHAQYEAAVRSKLDDVRSGKNTQLRQPQSGAESQNRPPGGHDRQARAPEARSGQSEKQVQGDQGQQDLKPAQTPEKSGASTSATPASKLTAEASSSPEASGTQAAAGKEVSRFAGMYGKGMTEFNARLQLKRLAKANPNVDYRVEASPEFGPDRHVVVGYEKPAQTERRTDTAQRKRVSEMSSAEKDAALLTDPLTELPNRRAFNEAPPKARKASIDIDGLKWVNDSMGHEAGDKLLRAAGLVFQEVGDGNVFHVSGDEFIAQADDDATLHSQMARAAKLMENLVVQVQRPDGTLITKTGVGFSYGLGDNLAQADHALHQAKSEREAAGLRPHRGERPGGVVESAAQGQPDRERPALDLAAQSTADLQSKEQRAQDQAVADKATADRERGAFNLAAPPGAVTQKPENSASNQQDLLSKPAAEMSAADHLRAAASKMDEAAKPAQQAPAPPRAEQPKAQYDTASKDLFDEISDSARAGTLDAQAAEQSRADDVSAAEGLSPLEKEVAALSRRLNDTYGEGKETRQGIPRVYVFPFEGRTGTALLFSADLSIGEKSLADVVGEIKRLAEQRGLPVVASRVSLPAEDMDVMHYLQGQHGFSAYFAHGDDKFGTAQNRLLSIWIPESYVGPEPRMSRRAQTETPVVKAWKMLAENERLFEIPISDSRDLIEIFRQATTEIVVEKFDGPLRTPGMEAAWNIYPIDKNGAAIKDRIGYVLQYKDGKVELNVNKFNEGDAGAQAYAAVGNYAHNNGLEFAGDRMGISKTGMERRLENMISLALKFGTTDFMSPHPEQMSKLGIDWKPGESDHNLEQMLLASYRNISTQFPKIKDIVYDFENGTFKDLASGTEIDERGIDRLALAARGRGFKGGSRTLKRAVFTGTVMQGAAGEGGGQLLDRIGAWARKPLDEAYVKALYSRSHEAPQTEGLSLSDAQAHVQAITSKWHNAPFGGIKVVESVDDLPKKWREWVASKGATGDLQGLFVPDSKTVYLIANQAASLGELEFTLLHETLGHFGLRGALNEDFKPTMRSIYLKNANVRAAAKQIMAQYGYDQITATEEALADMAGKGMEQGLLRQILAAIQKALRKIGMAKVADFLEGLSNAEVGQLLADAKKFVTDGPHALTTEMQPAMSRKSDETGLTVTGVPRELLNVYTRNATRALNALDRVLDPLGTLPNRDTYLKRRYKTLGVIARGDEIAGEIRKMFFTASEADKKASYDYLTTAEATPEGITSAGVRDQAVKVKQLINQVGDALVKRGLLSEEARESHRDAYLPRLYLKYLLNESDTVALGAGKKPSGMGYLKQRKDIPEETRRVMLGEVTEPGFLSATAIAKPLRDMALLDWLASIAEHEDWVLPNTTTPYKGQRVSVYWLKEEAARLRRQADYYEPDNATKAHAIAKEMDELADHNLDGMVADRKQYRQIPNTARYGRLRGIWVRKEIYNDIVGINDLMPVDPGFFQSLFGYGGVGTKITQLWKMGKVALNPPAQIRNFVSNGVMLQLSGVPSYKVPVRVVQAWKEIINDGPHWKVAKKYGVTESTFSAQELYRMKRELLDLENQMGKLGWLGKLHRLAAIVGEKASDVYQFSEALFKTAKIIDVMERGKDKAITPQYMDDLEANAALEAQKWMFDYSLVHKGVRYARNAPIGTPFITFQTKVLPRLLEVAALHPQRLLPGAALMYAMAYGLAAALGVDKQDLDKLMMALPKWIRDRGHTMLLPYKDAYGRWQVLDMGYFFPWTYWTTLAKDAGELDAKSAASDAGLFSGPVPSILTALQTGIDPFTDREIINKGDPPSRQALSVMNYLWSLAMPPILTEHGALGHALQSASGETNKYGDPRSTMGQSALRAVGVNIYALDAEQTRGAQMMQMQRDVQDTVQRLIQLSEDWSLTDAQRENLTKKYTDEIERRVGKLQKYEQDSEIAPQLATEH